MIDYVEITVAKLETALPERIEELHLAPRRSPKGGKVLMKLDNYKALFKEEVEEQLASIPMTLDETGEEQVLPEYVCPFPVYSGEALETLLANEEWASEENNVNILDAPQTASVLSDEDLLSSKSRKKSTKSSII